MNPQRIRKEIRALLPPWAAVVGLVAGLEALGHRFAVGTFATILALPAGSAMLAALSFGMEYETRTMLPLLAQPVPRRTIWTEKMTALTIALITLCLLSFCFALLFLDPWNGHLKEADFWEMLLAFGVVPLCALGATPLLTLISRSTLLATVISLLLPIFLVIEATWALDKMHYKWPGESHFWFSVGFLVVYALVMGGLGFWKFTRLQLADSRIDSGRWHFQIPIPWKSSTRSSTGFLSGPLGQLVRKEFRLQSISFIAALLFSAVWLSYRALKNPQPSETASAIFAYYTPIMMLIIGGVSIAGERSMGTMNRQFTLPVSLRKQWLIKLTVVFATSLMLGVLLPCLIARKGDTFFSGVDATDVKMYGALCIFMLGIAVFASSLSHTPVRGIILGALVFVIGCVMYVAMVCIAQECGSQFASNMYVSPSQFARAKAASDWIGKYQPTVAQIAMCCLALLSSYFSFLNHHDPVLHKRRNYFQLLTLFAAMTLWLGVQMGLLVKFEVSNKIVNQYQTEQERATRIP